MKTLSSGHHKVKLGWKLLAGLPKKIGTLRNLVAEGFAPKGFRVVRAYKNPMLSGGSRCAWGEGNIHVGLTRTASASSRASRVQEDSAS